MASVSLIKLTRLLLQRSDRHPVGRLNGNDQRMADPAAFSLFLHLGLVVEEPPLSEQDGVVCEAIGDKVWRFCADGTAVAENATIDDLRQFRIDLTALCRQIRKANNMQGAPVEPLGPFTFRIGAIGTGVRRRQFFLARALRARNALGIAYAIRPQADDGPIVILTPTARNLPSSTVRVLAADQIEIVAIDDRLDDQATDLLALRMPSSSRHGVVTEEPAALIIDTGGHRAHFHGVEIDLAPREFGVLVLLANEAADEAGIVKRDLLLDSLKEANGDEEVTPEQLDKVISRIRAAMTSAAGMPRERGRTLVITKRAVGYRLDLLPAAARVI